MNIVSTGTLNASLAHPREILKSAVLSNASATMLFHNHPSGNLTPSKEDIEITDRMSKLFALADMPLLDHIIIGNGDQYYSFKENSIMPIGTQMFARDPAEIKFENVAEPVVYEKRGTYHTTPEQRQEKIKQITDYPEFVINWASRAPVYTRCIFASRGPVRTPHLFDRPARRETACWGTSPIP
jgi:hypothetical protein